MIFLIINSPEVLMKCFGFCQSITTKQSMIQASNLASKNLSPLFPLLHSRMSFLLLTWCAVVAKDTLLSAASVAKTARDIAFLATYASHATSVIVSDENTRVARNLAMRVTQATQNATQYTQDTAKSAAQNAMRITHVAAHETARITQNAAHATKDAAQSAMRVTQDTAQEVTRRTVDAARYATHASVQATVGAVRSGYAWVSGGEKKE